MPGNANAFYAAKKAASLVNPIASTVFLQSDNSAKAASVYIPDQWQQNSVAGSYRFMLRAWGRITSGTSGNVTLVIQAGTSIVSASNTSFIAPTAATYSVSGNWAIDSTCTWDVTSKLLNGYFTGHATSAGTLLALASVTQLSTQNYSPNGLGFSIATLFGTTNAGNVAFLDGFTLEEI